ncbi:MAG: hypothetical protein H0U95_09785 [Bacteroidetes bacterium]|nr:hypothetical protein [Bacteroidota bacterium]
MKKLKKKPGIIFMDNVINDISSSDLLKEIKLLNPNIYVVLGIEPEEIKTAINNLNYGVFDYILKGDDEMVKAESILERTSKMRAIIKMKGLTVLV